MNLFDAQAVSIAHAVGAQILQQGRATLPSDPVNFLLDAVEMGMLGSTQDRPFDPVVARVTVALFRALGESLRPYYGDMVTWAKREDTLALCAHALGSSDDAMKSQYVQRAFRNVTELAAQGAAAAAGVA